MEVDTSKINAFLNGLHPDYDDVRILCTKDALSEKYLLKYFVYRGKIKKITPLNFRTMRAPKTKLPDRLEYLVELHDEVGKIVLNSPTAVDERKIHEQMVEAHNSDDIVELMTYVLPYPEINGRGEIINAEHKVITRWPIKLRVIKDPGENAEFYHSGTGWKIIFRRQSELYVDEIGFYYLHELLKMPNTLISTANLYFSKSGYDNLGYSEYQIDNFRQMKLKEKKEMGQVPISKDPVKIKAIKDLREQIEILRTKIEYQSESDSEEEVDGFHEGIELHLAEIKEILGEGTSKDDYFIEIIKKTRTSVQKAIMRALKKIKKQQPTLGAILVEQKRIQTGGSCRYADDKDHPITWLT